MVNYSNGKIYKIEPICDHEEGEVYIGSTTKQYLSQRFDSHRSSYKRWLNGNYNKTTVFQLFEKYGVKNCDITLIELVEASCKDELQGREKHYIRITKCVNKYIPTRTRKEYEAEFAEQISAKHKIYYQKHRDYCLEQKAQYRKNHTEQANEYAYHYRLENKQKTLDYARQYRIREVFCDCCGLMTNKGYWTKHIKTKFHLKNSTLYTIEYEYQLEDGTPCTEQEYNTAMSSM